MDAIAVLNSGKISTPNHNETFKKYPTGITKVIECVRRGGSIKDVNQVMYLSNIPEEEKDAVFRAAMFNYETKKEI